jgi:antirestriction protein ArdC
VNGFPSHEWMTFQQAIQRNASVRKGSKGTTVVFTTRIQRDDEDDDKMPRSMLKTYHVFNVDQIDGLPDPPPSSANTIEPIEVADALIRATGADIRLGGSKACYVPTHDFVAIPPKEAFQNTESFYAVSLHELGHWSGSEKRLNRNLDSRFGTRAYAAEELIAELSAAFLCAHLGITGELRHAGYIDHWIDLLSEDKRAIFTAASKASETANFLRAFSEPNSGNDRAD